VLPPLTPAARLRWSVVRRLLPSRADGVLEVGCGQGGVAARLARRYGGYVGVEMDPTSAAVARARVQPEGGQVRQGLVQEVLGADERFDLLCAFEVLEHIEDDEGSLRDWVQRLRPGGRVLLSVPAWPDRFSAADVAVGHYRRYTPAAASDLLSACGLADARVALYGWPLGYLLERGRNLALERKALEQRDLPAEQRSAASGRTLQPPSAAGAAVAVGVAPFALLQRAIPTRGTGLVLTAVSPGATGR
jgi:SAM-dependent methyltransferase